MLETPILFLIFNRPETTERVFNEIRKQKPKYLFVAADGPRTNVVGEAEKCKKAREVVMNAIDWDCELKTLFRDSNWGCGPAVWQAIIWFFEQVEEGIILEDDILPDTTFFKFCEEMLERYRTDTRLRFINGCNFGYNLKNKSYGFTRFMNMWGWATWRRSIDLVDFKMNEWSLLQNKKEFLSNIFEGQSQKIKQISAEYFKKIFDKTISSEINTWDYQCVFSNFLTQTYCVYPGRNLIRNLGLDNDGTHTKFESYFLTDLQIKKMDFPLIDIPELRIDIDYEKFVIERWAHLKIRNRLYYSIYHRKYLFMKFIKKQWTLFKINQLKTM